jgi:methylmalonyl-CoA mutase C-terminal domain/subunit
LIAKPGLDGHDRGAKVVARALRDAGMEVIYLGLHSTVQEIVEAALQEDVDVIGLSILSGAHRSIVPKLTKLANEKQLNNIVYIVGGIIPQGDIPYLQSNGVHAVYGPMTNLDLMTDFVRNKVQELRPL